MSEPKTWHSEPVMPDAKQDLRAWLQNRMNEQRCWLLAHADDGINWGRLSNGNLVTSHDAAPGVAPALSWDTLQQAFIFGPTDEIKLWRVGGEWQARRLSETADSDTFDETQLLWGDETIDDVETAHRQHFTHLHEHRQKGLDHIVPLAVDKTQLETGRRIKLQVRHFIAYDENGAARIALSRLVNINVE